MTVSNTGSLLCPPLAASASEDIVQNSYTDLRLRPRHLPAYFSSNACTVTDNSHHPGLRSAEREDLFIPRTTLCPRKKL